MYDLVKGASIELWIGRNRPLDPYKKGVIINYLKEKLKPKQLVFPPEDACYPSDMECLELTILAGWVTMWFKWLKDYSLLMMEADPTIDIDDFIKLPIIETSWYRRTKDIKLFKYGVIWKLYDMYADMPAPLAIAEGEGVPSFIQGGAAGLDFILYCEVDQSKVN